MRLCGLKLDRGGFDFLDQGKEGVDINGFGHEGEITDREGTFAYTWYSTVPPRIGTGPITLDGGARLALRPGGSQRVELATSMLGEAGFGDVEVSRLPHDPFNAYFVARPLKREGVSP